MNPESLSDFVPRHMDIRDDLAITPRHTDIRDCWLYVPAFPPALSGVLSLLNGAISCSLASAPCVCTSAPGPLKSLLAIYHDWTCVKHLEGSRG